LTLTGLFWLAEGNNTIGSDPASAIVVPRIAADAGRLVLRDQTIRLEPAAGSQFSIALKPVLGATELVSDVGGEPTDVRIGDCSLTVIRRSGLLAVRLRDRTSAVRTGFAGLTYFPERPEFKLIGRFTRAAAPVELKVATAIGREEAEIFVGQVEFEWEGKTFRMQAQERAGGQLFLTFRDATSGTASYGACRFLLCPAPLAGVVDLDFNRAYNPPCAFTPWATCSLPHPDNRLPFPVEAGEMAP